MKNVSPERQRWIVEATRLMVNDFDRGIAISNFNILMDQIDIAVSALKKLEKYKSHRPKIRLDKPICKDSQCGCCKVCNRVTCICDMKINVCALVKTQGRVRCSPPCEVCTKSTLGTSKEIETPDNTTITLNNPKVLEAHINLGSLFEFTAATVSTMVVGMLLGAAFVSSL